MTELAAPPALDDRQPEHEWLTRGVRSIGVASFLSDVGHEVPTALLPTFLTRTLRAPAAALGLVEGIADGFGGVGRLTGGALSDDPHRRRTVALGGYSATAVFAAMIGLCTAVWQVAFLRAASWFTRGLRSPARNALLADVVPPGAYGRAYGFERTMDNLGAIVGPALALGLVALFSLRVAIVLSVIPGLLAALAILVAIRATPKPERRERVPIRLRVRPVMQGQLGRLLTGIGAFEVANAAATLLILRATDLLTPSHGEDTAAKIGIALYMGYNVAATLVSFQAGRVADRRGNLVVLVAGAAFFLLAYLGFALAGPQIVLLAVCFAAAGVGIGLIETAEHSAVALLAPAEVRGSAFGILAGIQSLGNLAASAIAGLLWTLVSPEAAFLYLFVWCGAAIVLLLRARSAT